MSIFLLTEMARAEREAEGIVYGWIITRDLVSDGEDLGTAGPRSISQDLIARLQKGEGRAFRMLDDDGEVYYHGRYIGEGSDDPTGGELTEEAFLPLEDFGTPNAGAIEIQYHLGGKWVSL